LTNPRLVRECLIQSCNKALSLLLSVSLIVSFDGCNKSSAPAPAASSPQGQAPTATYATPTADQLYQLVAPIALFPDNLVALVLAGSTFPDQITAAYQWLQQNSALKGQQLLDAVNQQPWDASVKGLTQFSDVVQQMANSLSWTSSLGDAYFNVPQSVMNAVQVMRQRAYSAGNLKSNQQQNVTVQNQAAGSAPPAQASSGESQVTVVQSPPQTIVIQPAQPEVVYVPTYNPTVVYGAPVAAYPGYSTGDMVATGLISFGLGIAVGAAISGGGCCGWGYNSWGCGWHNSSVTYNRNTYVSNSNTFVNRNNYSNRNINNANFNRNNINTNDINRNNFNRNNQNVNNRANNFGNGNSSTPKFNQKLDQPQFRNTNASNLAQQRGGQQPNFNQQNRLGNNQNQGRPGNLNQNQRQPQRGYGQQPNRGNDKSAFGNYGQGGNARTNSARGQQSLQGGNRTQAAGGANRAQGAGAGGGNRAGGGPHGGGGRGAGGGRPNR
jgi:Protein of unknown function (DUF3300)